MTARSTRNKMRWQCEKVMSDLTKSQNHLKMIDDMSGGESKYLNDNLPNLTALLEYMIKIIKTFREGL